MELTNEQLVSFAKKGNKQALEDLVRRIQDQIYKVSLRMLYDPADAEDATQEILIRIITHLGGFRKESAFTTWAYRIAANYLLSTRRKQVTHSPKTFEEYESSINRKSAESWRESESEAQQGLIVEEVMISCLQGLLLCLDSEHRLAYVLGEIFEVSSDQGAEILDITPAAFRKRLSRARARIRDFMLRNCSLINPANPCFCENQVAKQIKKGTLNTRNLKFATHHCRVRHDKTVLCRLKELDQLHRTSAYLKLYPDFATPAIFVENIKSLVSSGQFDILAI